MPTDLDATLAPEDAFSLLGNETRVRILQALGTMDGPLSFTELRTEVGIPQGGQFNYHLDQLVGHFIEKTEAGYALRQPGERVVQAVVSGAVTERPYLEPTEVSWWPCPYCEGVVAIGYHDERVERFCTECEGFLGRLQSDLFPFEVGDFGYLDYLYLPPAGMGGRDPSQLLRAAFTWAYAEWLVAAHDVCPRCSATVDHTVDVCPSHDTEGFCATCGEKNAIRFETACSNCTFSLDSIASMHLAASMELLDFVTDHGINPIGDPWDWGWEYDETIVSFDPLEAVLSFTIDDETLTLTVDDELTIVEATRETA